MLIAITLGILFVASFMLAPLVPVSQTLTCMPSPPCIPLHNSAYESASCTVLGFGVGYSNNNLPGWQEIESGYFWHCPGRLFVQGGIQ